MSIILSNAEVGPSRRELKIEVPAEVVAAEAGKVVQEIRRRAKLPGFRPGKVPREVVERRYREDIEREVLERVVPDYWHRAQHEAHLEPLMAPRVKDVEYQPGSPVTFVATVEVRPEIALRNLKDFSLPPVEVEPARDEISHAVEDLRRSRGTWQDVDRAAVRGDLILGALVELAAKGGEPKEGEEPRPVQFEVGDPRVWEELTLAATGVFAGREVELARREEGEGAGERHFRLRIDGVRELLLPELDDELAKQFGVADVSALTAEVEGQLRRAKTSDNRRQREHALLEQLIERHPVTLPEWAVEEEIKSLLSEQADELARQGVDVEKAEIDWNKLAESARPAAERRVHARLLLDAVAKQEGLQVSEQDVLLTVGAIARAQGKSPAVLRRELEEAGKLGALAAQLRRERAIRHLLGDLPAADQPDAEGNEATETSPAP